ncbi:MAG: SRPBCC family protein [Chloroflexi bacterium]|nr:SRPBCC family protein [Chloroflexota bacterium]
MGIDITAEVTIERPREAVAAFAMDSANDPAWIGGVVESKALTDGPFGKGSKVGRTAKFLGRRMEYTTEVVEYEPSALVAMRAESPFPMTIRYEFVERAGRTLARIRVTGEGSGFYNLAAPLLAMMVKRNVSRDLRTLKRLLESDG